MQLSFHDLVFLIFFNYIILFCGRILIPTDLLSHFIYVRSSRFFAPLTHALCNRNITHTYATHSQHVLTEDTLERHIKDGKLYSKRLLSKTNHVPKWGERFYNAKSVKIVEESVCDPKTKTLTTYTRNVAFTKVMVSLFSVAWMAAGQQLIFQIFNHYAERR